MKKHAPRLEPRPRSIHELTSIRGGAEVVTIPMGTNKLPIKSLD